MINREIKKDRPSLSKAQIEKHKDFSSVLKRAQSVPIWKNKWFWGGSGLAVIAVVTTIFLMQNPPEKTDTNKVANKSQKHYALTDSSFQNVWSNAEGGVYQFKYGAEVKIPKNAFVLDGAVYKGKTEIRFKSYHDYADIMAHQIDMKYDSAGQSLRLETGGMFDFYAFSEDGELLEIADDKSINVEMPTQNDEDFNFYFYNPASSEWEYQGKANTIIANNKEANESNAVHKQEENQNKKELYAAKEQCQKTIIDLKHNQPIKPITEDQTNFKFELDIDMNAFPELKSFDGLEMAFHPSVPNNKTKILKKTWSDMQLHVIEKGVLYELELKDGNKTERLKVVPIGESDLWNEKMEIYQNWEADLSKEEQKLKQIEAEIQKHKEEILENQKQEEQARLELLNPEETKDTIKDLSAFVEIRQAIDAAEANQQYLSNGKIVNKNPKLAAYNQLRRQYDIRRTGRFNCDRPVKYPENQKVQAVFAFNDTLKFDKVVLIDEKRNTTFPYTFNEFHSFGYHPKHNNIIFAFDKKGNPYYFSPHKFEFIDKKTDQFLFNLEPCRKDISSSEKLRLFITEQWEYAAQAI